MGSVRDDLDLVRRVLADEPRSFEALQSRVRPVVDACLERVAAGAPWIRPDARDLRQQFLTNLLEDDARILRGFEGRSSLTTYLHVVATRFFHREATRARSRRGSIPLEEAGTLVDQGRSPEDAAWSSEALAQLKGVVEELPADERLLLALLFEQELGAPEIAEALGITASGVRMRKHRLLGRIARRLFGDGDA